MTRKLSTGGSCALVLSCLLVAAMSHSYRGIVHDARLYTLQALGRLEPSSLGMDVFLRFGSQDRFTIFTSIYAAGIHAVGPDAAAATLTVALQFAMIVAAFVLARTVLPSSYALLGLGVMVSLPGDYGAEQIFTYIESFVTPRMAAECLVLLGMAAALANRRMVALALLVSAALFHPIMATAGFVSFAYRYTAFSNLRIAGSAAIFGAAMLLGAATLMPVGQWGRFDQAWLGLVMNRSPYLFLQNWSLNSWGTAAVSATTLLLGTITLPESRCRSLCKIVLATALSGFALTLVAVDMLHLVLFAQLQPWRCQWLATVVAALVLPSIMSVMWRIGAAGRAVALILASAWIFGSGEYALLACAAAIACRLLAPKATADQIRLYFYGACGMTVIALIWRTAVNFTFAYSHSLDEHLAAPLRHLISFCHDGMIPIIAIVAIGWFLRSPGIMRPLIVCAACITAGALILPAIAAQWTVNQFSPSLIEQYAPWRAVIPTGAQVYWPQSPEYSWILLHRPNYVSGAQSAGMVFSRAAAIELKRRAESLQEFVPPDAVTRWDAGESSPLYSMQQLQGICLLGAFDFLVSSTDIGVAPVAIQPGKSALDPKAFKLYRCHPQARAAAAAT